MTSDSGHLPIQTSSTCCCSGHCDPSLSPNPSGNPIARIPSFRIPSMDCPVEENQIRQALAEIQGIRTLRFELSARTLQIEAEHSALEAALTAIRALGFEVQPLSSAQQEPKAKFSELTRTGIALALALVAEAIHYLAPETWLFGLLGMSVAAAAIGFAGLSTYQKGLAALRRGQLNMNALMGVAVTGAFLIGQWPEAAMVMALYAIAELIEAKSLDRARQAIQKLLALAPETAEVQQADGRWLAVPAANVALGAVVRVKPGARIPLDGRISKGQGAVNQSSVTGESIPVDKVPGDALFAGTINETSTLEFEVTATANNTTLARIIHAVEAAQASRAPMQRFIDRFAALYTPAVFVGAVLVALSGPWLFDWTALEAIYKALVLLIIACPCALVIATPVTIVSGLAAAARQGILIKGGAYLEQARHLKAIALDKTGTLTEGKPRLVAVHLMPSDYSEAQVLAWAAALAEHSDHPVSKAIATGLTNTNESVVLEQFNALPGRGIEAHLGSHRLVLGNHRLIEERGLCSPEIETYLSHHEAQGHTLTLLASASEVLAIFAVADTLKHSSRSAMSRLQQLGVTPCMLTGDNLTTAQAIAKEAGIAQVQGNLLPEDKLATIQTLHQQYGTTAMVGDGINDAPALVKADIGIAMGGAGTDIAMEAADVVIMNDDLRRLPELIQLSRATYNVLWQNIAFALGIKGVFFALALTGNATMWMAVFADMGASLLVVANGLRVLHLKPQD
ncbi:Cd2+/Zn2+-exporting ATPase [Azomonas agilis]|uniref:P-type Zn(2+) transporter n=1 Tax=Azomonas agilis TaxID=116849 RepID=A0A562I179_9GAMM|nr:cation-translocating P-type ATPase [Azomonas agilis]TWH64413.1 Cd2+/Zn2+-exporting ATPase [Azomonas agilis]